jgi:hypothetical protein
MADDTDKEHLDIHRNAPLENSSEEITAAKDTVAIIQNQEIENMEVHRHPHHEVHEMKTGKNRR